MQQNETAASHETIVVLDFGSQYSQLITRRVRENQVYCEMLPWDVPAETLAGMNPKGIILSGGPNSVYDPGAPFLADHVLALKVPVLGICYGMQLLASRLGGRVAASADREYGPAVVSIDGCSQLFAGLGTSIDVWMSHGDRIEQLAPGARSLAHTANSPYAAMADEERHLYGLQFHPEVVHTPHGNEIISNFLDICGCRRDWSTGSFIDASITAIKRAVGHGRVVCGVSGGVDSTVVATLVRRAIGSQLTAVFVNNGLLRKNEAEENIARFQKLLGESFTYVDAGERFLDELHGVTDPEQKRKIIGRIFVEVFDQEANRFGNAEFLAQGTLYPDVIESASTGKSAARIKTHHNVGGLPAKMRLKLIEPVKYLFKDEVRRVGIALGLPEDLVYRAPFPGPGLAVRVIGEVTPERLAVLRDADAIVRDEIAAAGLDRDVWQYFAVLTPLHSVGVMGDGRTYANVLAIRAVTSQDAMTADWARLPYELLARMSNRIVNEVSGVNRVVYDITSKPPATIEWE
ncbi:MAG: glutamine-hydrolyzing GMP synthase [Chloroflexi bacterium]|nr:glutamine-hydrolyzing GMP synthase [Chloroflexota bacterium]